MKTLGELLATRAQDEGSATQTALCAPGGRRLSYAGLQAQCTYTARVLAALGVSGEDRVALVLPNGAEMAACFVSVASVATCAPLNPAYREAELEFYFDDLAPRVVIVAPETAAAARKVAASKGVPVLTLRPRSEAAGTLFELLDDEGELATEQAALSPAPADAVGLILHTSGTTSRPKMVPLSQANLMASARHIADTLQLSSADRCLNIMPLFHIHGLIGVLLSSLFAGASVVCSPGFDSRRFFPWLREEQPTWMSAVPTMYEAIASLFGQHADDVAAAPLRLLRSSSASMPPPLMQTLEATFGVPVIEAYGMTEATHQMASNPLPPAVRKAGSVGLPAGPEVAIMDVHSPRLLPALAVGEIVIRGPNVTSGYLANPKANATAFAEGYFRTGDQGYFDEDGYLFISGRLKEIINRGGEKISPREVDEAILALPGVRQAVAFALPHATLGEDVGAAVVLREGCELSEVQIRDALAQRLAPFKVPSRVLVVEQIPKGPTGKLQRIGLAEKLEPLLKQTHAPPETPLQAQLVTLYGQTLGIDEVGIHDSFFALGGDSLRAVALAEHAAAQGLSIPLEKLLREPTIAGLAPHVQPLSDYSSDDDGLPGRLRLYAFQRSVLHPMVARPEDFSSPSEVVFEADGPVDEVALLTALRALVDQHEGLRLRFTRTEKGGWLQELVEPTAIDDRDLRACVNRCDLTGFREAMAGAHRAFDLGTPPLLSLIVTEGAPGRIGITTHHLVADAVSMRVLGDDFALAYSNIVAGEPAGLTPVPTPMAAYVRRYGRASKAGVFAQDREVWLGICDAASLNEPDPTRHGFSGQATVAGLVHRTIPIEAHTTRILASARRMFTSPRDVLVALSALSVVREFGLSEVRAMLMMSGREYNALGAVSRTVGCLAHMVPLRLPIAAEQDLSSAQRAATCAIDALPSGGVSIGSMLSDVSVEEQIQVALTMFRSQLFVNYKGTLGPRSPLASSCGPLTALPSSYAVPTMMAHLQAETEPVPECFMLQMHYEVSEGKLFGDLFFASEVYERARIESVLSRLSALAASLPDA